MNDTGKTEPSHGWQQGPETGGDEHDSDGPALVGTVRLGSYFRFAFFATLGLLLPLALVVLAAFILMPFFGLPGLPGGFQVELRELTMALIVAPALIAAAMSAGYLVECWIAPDRGDQPLEFDGEPGFLNLSPSSRQALLLFGWRGTANIIAVVALVGVLVKIVGMLFAGAAVLAILAAVLPVMIMFILLLVLPYVMAGLMGLGARLGLPVAARIGRAGLRFDAP
ncbi:MAG: hypothetical protein EP335_15445 [Alphaproteobacteria bacterium]|nr:MAG: hypothetical protein EP335_15445 [Alphaproteobacteria bacterium]